MSDGETEAYRLKADRRRVHVTRLCDGGLLDDVERAGGELLGMSVRWRGYDCLVTLRARFPAGSMVAFVGGETLGGCLVKAAREARGDALKWRVDRYAKE